MVGTNTRIQVAARKWAGLWAGRACRLASDTGGMAGVEMAVLLLPLLMFTFGVTDVGMLMLTDSVVGEAAAEAARQIRTGELKSNADITAFRTKLCATAVVLPHCAAAIAIDVRSFAGWGSVNWPVPVYAPDGTVTNFSFHLGGASAITTVRVIYTYHVLTPGLSFLVDHVNRAATAVLLTEPYDT
jgi:Flp pilus assembly protein TadG